MSYQIKKNEYGDKYVEITVTVPVYLKEDSFFDEDKVKSDEVLGILNREEVTDHLFEEDRVDLGERVLNAFTA